ncbi:TniB family NTP-binding protein, partial [Bacillus sp. JJ1773]
MEVKMESPILNTNYSDIKRPKIPVGGHPLEQGDYLIDTVSINDIADSILKWINMRNPGAIIYGPPRLGKTYAVKYLKKYFDIKYKSQWETYIVRTRKMKTPNENRFFEYVLKDVGHELYKIGKPDAKRDRLVNFLWDKGDRTQEIKLYYLLMMLKDYLLWN